MINETLAAWLIFFSFFSEIFLKFQITIFMVHNLLTIRIHLSLNHSDRICHSHRSHLLTTCGSVDNIHTPGFKIFPMSQTYKMGCFSITDNRGNSQNYNCVKRKDWTLYNIYIQVYIIQIRIIPYS